MPDIYGELDELRIELEPVLATRWPGVAFTLAVGLGMSIAIHWQGLPLREEVQAVVDAYERASESGEGDIYINALGDS